MNLTELDGAQGLGLMDQQFNAQGRAVQAAGGAHRIEGRVIPRALGRHQKAPLLVVLHDPRRMEDRKSTRLNSSHVAISYAVFCLKKKKKNLRTERQTGG